MRAACAPLDDVCVCADDADETRCSLLLRCDDDDDAEARGRLLGCAMRAQRKYEAEVVRTRAIFFPVCKKYAALRTRTLKRTRHSRGNTSR